jgi:hypothetical protein
MGSMSQDVFTWFITFLSYNPEQLVWLGFGTLLVICSTERVATADYVDFILTGKVSSGTHVFQEHG